MNRNLFLKTLKARMVERGDTQSSLSRRTGVGQSQISKILKGDFTRTGSAVLKLAEYSGFREYPKQNLISEEINAAVAEVWDGTKEMERQLAETIRELGSIWIK